MGLLLVIIIFWGLIFGVKATLQAVPILFGFTVLVTLLEIVLMRWGYL